MVIFMTPATASAQTFGSLDSPQTNLVPIGPPPSPFAPGATGNFDPYATLPNASGIGPPVGFGSGGFGGGGFASPSFPTTAAPPSLGGIFSQPASTYGAPTFGTPTYGAPVYGPPPATGYSNPYAAPTFQYDNSNVYGAPPTYPGSIYPSSTPTTLFPEGMFGSGAFAGFSGLGGTSQLYRGPRFRHTFIGFGDSANDLNTNDTDVSLVLAWENFLYSNQPLYVVPSFSLHLWDGPQTTVPGAASSAGADLPGSAYSGFLDIGWNSDPNQILSTELGVRVGAFTDFDTFNDESIRVLGKALVSFRLSPTATLKGGAYYLDRNDIKLVPAGGLLWQPNPYTRFDIFFPQPKFARYLRTVGTFDTWWYVAGDYGGGSWTVTRRNGDEDSIDINELRAVFGLEWGQSEMIRAGRRVGFFEIGYAFNREIEYRRNPAQDIDLDDGIMFRLGIGY